MDIYQKLFKSHTAPAVLLEEKEGIFILKDFSRTYSNLVSKGNAIVLGSTFRQAFNGLQIGEWYLAEVEKQILNSVQTRETQEITIYGTGIENNEIDEQKAWRVEFTPFKEGGGHVKTSLMITFDVKTSTRFGFRDQEEEFVSIFKNSLDGILFTVPDGRILAANPEACRMFQMTEEELRMVGRDGVVDMKDPRLSKALKRRETTSKVRSELTFVRKDGSKFPGEVTSSVFVDASGEERTCIILRDMTIQKQVEEELRKRDGIVHGQDSGGNVRWKNISYKYSRRRNGIYH